MISKEKLSYYSGMLPGYIAGMYPMEEISIDIEEVSSFTDAKFICSECTEIDPTQQKVILQNGERIFYDYLIVNIGSKTRVNFEIE